jgi:tRNA(fMet)-specific endonuclease VapC
MFVFDTDHVGIIQWQSEPEYSRLLSRMSQHAEEDFFVTITSFHEEILGWNSYIANAKKIDGVVKAYGRLLRILTDFNASQVLPFDEAAARISRNCENRKYASEPWTFVLQVLHWPEP